MHLFSNLSYRQSLSIALQDLLIASEMTLTRGGRRRLLMSRPCFLALGKGSRTQLLLPKRETRRDPTQHAFERLAPIFDDVPPIHDLLGRWSAKLCPASILPGTISADPLHPRVSAEPVCEGLCGPIRQ